MEQKDLEKIVRIILSNKEYTKEELTRLVIEAIRAIEKPPRVIYPYYPYYTNTPNTTWQDSTKLPLWTTSSTDTGTTSGFDSVRETKNK